MFPRSNDRFDRRYHRQIDIHLAVGCEMVGWWWWFVLLVFVQSLCVMKLYDTRKFQKQALEIKTRKSHEGGSTDKEIEGTRKRKLGSGKANNQS